MTTSTEGITLLGSEMLTWSDFDGEVGAFGGLLAPHLLHAFGGERGRVLVVGPTAAPVVADVAARFAGADVLVRSWADAQTLRASLPEAVGVFCGPLDRMARTGATYDAVVAVAGTDRLHSAEDETPGPAKVLADLVSLVSGAGELYLGVGNPVGVDRLLSLAAGSRHHDADWPDGHLVPAAALTVEEVIAVLAEHGLAPVETWFCHGRRSDPLAAASVATLSAGRADTVLLRELARAYDVTDASAMPLKDPAATVHDLVRAGLGAATAPLAVLHLSRTATPAPDLSALVCEPVHDGAPSVAYRLTRTGSGWVRSLLSEPAQFSVSDLLSRDTAALEGPVAAGETIAEQLAACCAAHDVAAAGVVVRRYRDWLGSDPGTPVPADRVALLPRLVVGDERLEVLDASWTALESAPRDVVLVRGLLDVSADLLARGIRHPWSPGSAARDLTTALAAAAGIEDLAPVLVEALALDARLRPAGTAPDYDEPAGISQLSHAELVEIAEGLGQRVSQSDAHVVWLLQRLQGRQRALRQLRGQLNAVNGSREMRAGRLIFFVHELVRRRRRARAEAADRPGEWRDPATRPPEPQREGPIEIESNLIPPAYEPGPEIKVVPPED
ncbi:MAG: hypothetical protein JWR52_2692 [Marmoricola sp.]|nr:hypothetical protein [Marmoricola sp.]